MDPLEAVRTLGEQFLAGTPQAGALGMSFVEASRGVGVLKVAWRPDLVGDPATGVIAGGVITTLLDHCCGLAVLSAMERYSNTATLDLRIDYMRAAKPGLDVFARAHCYKITRSVAFVRAGAYDADPEDPVATAQAAFMLSPLRPPRPRKSPRQEP